MSRITRVIVRSSGTIGGWTFHPPFSTIYKLALDTPAKPDADLMLTFPSRVSVPERWLLGES